MVNIATGLIGTGIKAADVEDLVFFASFFLQVIKSLLRLAIHFLFCQFAVFVLQYINKHKIGT